MAVSVADPSREDCPIVAVSMGFVELTGFTREQIVGRNCRLLNSERSAEMAPEVREGIHRAIREETTFLGMVGNVKADGTRFNNLLHLSPLDLGSKTYMVGVQAEVEEEHNFLDGPRREATLAVVRKAHGV